MEYELNGRRSHHSNVTITAPLTNPATATTETFIGSTTHLVRAGGWHEVVDPGRWIVKHCFGDPGREKFHSEASTSSTSNPQRQGILDARSTAQTG